MRGFAIRATDGEIGSVDDFLFDDEQWTIRYLVANTGSWLTGRLVLVSPIAFRAVDWDGQAFAVNLTRRQVEESPGIATDQPVSRQMEEQYFRYYGYPYYWAGPGLWAGGMYPVYTGHILGTAPAPIAPSATEREVQQSERPHGDQHLRSVRAVTGYAIQARDDDLGHVEDFIMDDQSWAIRYMVVDTRNWWPGKRVLAAPQWITSVSWAESSVHVDLMRETIKSAPEYDSSALLDREYETRLYRHYGRPAYWEEPDDA
jgi:hypothetical protein